MGEAFTAAAKYVLARGEHPLPWDNSHRLRGIDDVAALKHGDGNGLLIQGSSTIYAGLLAAGLLDQLLLYTFPLVLGPNVLVLLFEKDMGKVDQWVPWVTLNFLGGHHS